MCKLPVVQISGAVVGLAVDEASSSSTTPHILSNLFRSSKVERSMGVAMQRKYIWTAAIVILMLSSVGVGAEAADNEAIRKSGLIGRWAIDCSKALGSSNPNLLYAVGSPNPTLTLSMALRDRDGTFDIRSVKLIGNNRISFFDKKRGEAFGYKVVVEVSGNRLRSISSVKDDGTVEIRDGMFLFSNRPTPLLEKCS